MGKVRPGDPLKVKASDYNSFLDAADFVRKRIHDVRMHPAGAPAQGSVKILNACGETIPRFGIVRLSGVEAEGLYRAEKPTGPRDAVYAVAKAPVENTAIGGAWFGIGTCPVLCENAELITFPSMGVPQAGSFRVASSSGGRLRLPAAAVIASAPSEPVVIAQFTQTPLASKGEIQFFDGDVWAPLPAPAADSVLFFNSATGLPQWIATTTLAPPTTTLPPTTTTSPPATTTLPPTTTTAAPWQPCCVESLCYDRYEGTYTQSCSLNGCSSGLCTYAETSTPCYIAPCNDAPTGPCRIFTYSSDTCVE